MADVIAALAKPKLAAEGLRPSDGVDDMTHISDIDVTGINENLRVRYKRDEIYTYTGTILVAVNPYKFLPVYEQADIDRYHGKKMGEAPPHVFATAEAAFCNVQRTDRNQSCVISGESGAGKTETTKFILQYLCTVTSSTSKWVEQQILECNVILEAFGNAKTVRNDNSSRFGKFIQVCFDNACEIKGSIIQEYLLEQSRITNQSEGERNYHIFYQLLKGGDKGEYLLGDVKSLNYVNQSGTYTLDGVDDAKAFSDLRMAMTVLNIPENMSNGIFKLISAVLWVGNIEFIDLEETVGLTDNDKAVCGRVATLLGLTQRQIETVVTTRQIIVRGQATTIPFKLSEARENRNAMAKALYSRTFTWLVDLINGTTNPGSFTQKFIGVLDIFGFENFKVNSFEQLCINFTNEKLHKFFNHYVFALEQAEYEREGIDFAHINFTDNTPCLELIEKPPKCILRLLDEECRFPKGSDESFLGKQHGALGSHPNYAMPDKTRTNVYFGVKHFAGTVMYTIYGFLDKNKDVTQDQLFDFMRESSVDFVRDVCKFQNMLALDRKVVMGKKLRRTRSIAPGSGSAPESLRTNKAKPTVGDTFRRQLGALIEVLEDTTPWYVRCVKPNSQKAPGQYDDALCETQLNYSGMLDIVRIRKEGFPVHVPAASFVSKYRSMAAIMGKKLPQDPVAAVRAIMTFINAPTTEWQIGKTKVFLRNSVFEPLEEALRKLLHKHVVLIQSTWRGYYVRSQFQRKLRAIVRIQSAMRAYRQRLQFLRVRRAVVTLQAATRGWRDREMVKEMKMRADREARRKKQAAKAAKEREAVEAGDAKMEDSMQQAQRELFAMSKFTEKSADTVAATTKVDDMGSMFESLLNDKPKTSDADKLTSELDAMLAGKDAPNDASGSASSRVQPGKKTMRRRKRIEKREAEQAQQQELDKKPDAEQDAAKYNMENFAAAYFNEHYWRDYAVPKATLKRRKAYDRSLTSAEMVRHTSSPTLPASMIHLHNPEDNQTACIMWKDIFKQLTGALRPELLLQSTKSIIAYCLERPVLRDEVFCQVMRQATNCPEPADQRRAWLFFAVLVVSFPPSKRLYPYMQTFIRRATADNAVSKIAEWCHEALKCTKINGERKLAPSETEIEAIHAARPLAIRFFFLDNTVKAIGVHPCSTAQDTIKQLAEKIGMDESDGWALFEVTPDFEHYLRGTTYIGDVLAEWEAATRSSMQTTKYKTISRKGSVSSALGGGDSKFVFRQRLFLNPQEVPKLDVVRCNLMYAQAVQMVTLLDDLPTTPQTALQLAGLQAQTLFGDADSSNQQNRYTDQLNLFLPERLRTETYSAEEWVSRLYAAHKEYGTGLSVTEAKVMYLTAVKQYQLFGGTFFPVTYKGHWSHPSKLILSVHNVGIKFVHPRNKSVMAEYDWNSLKSVEVDAFEHTITLNMNKTNPEDSDSFSFATTRKEDIANLIASYSPKHRKWRSVGVAPVHSMHTSADERLRLIEQLKLARRGLGDAGILMRPPEKSGFTTLRARRRGSKFETDKSDAVGQEFAKAYPDRYWSYSKTRITQPLSQMSSEGSADLSLRLFASLLVYAGLAGSTQGDEVDPENINLVQVAISKCIEKEDVCNEFYLQIVKQTTDNPYPDSQENVAAWQMFALVLGVCVPRNPHIRAYIEAHLRLCATNGGEEAAYAQFCQTCMARTTENRNRKYPPSKREIQMVRDRRPIIARFYFTGGEFRTFAFDAAATTAEVVTMLMEKLGLPRGPQSGFSLFEVFGPLQRNMLHWEKVADAMFKWEKYAKTSKMTHELQLTFKKRIFLAPHVVPKLQAEFDLVLHQAIDDVRSDRFPISNQDAAYLVALQAQVEMGDIDLSRPAGDRYRGIIDKQLPKHLRGMVQPEDIVTYHQKIKGVSRADCNTRYLKFIMAWPLYGATIFDVVQEYTPTLPKNLWLAVDEKGVHILRRRNKEPLISYDYRAIVSYSPSLRNLMICTESLTRGTKYVFTTAQASQIAHLMKDFTHIILRRRAAQKQAAAGGDKPH